MKGWNRAALVLSLAAAIFSLAAGCGQKESAKPADAEEEKPQQTNQPVTIRMFNHFNNISDERLQQFIVEPLKQRMPHVTFEVVKDQAGSKIEDLIASGTFPDLYYGSNVGLPSFLNVQLQQDITELVKKHGIDLNRFESTAIDAIKVYAEKGELFGIPFSANLGIMIYNKDIFDKFGVPYPKDGMDWDEVTELGRRLTRQSEGVQYIGFDPGPLTNVASGLALSYVDPKTKRALLDTEDWRRVFGVVKKAYEIPGYVTNGKFDYGTTGFIKDRIVAMMPIWALQVLNARADLSKMNWDMVSLPNFKDALGRGREIDIHLLALSNLSKNKDAAIEVLKVITSDEVQMMMSEYGTPSVLNNEGIKKNYGSKLPEFQGKNVQALFKTKPNKPHLMTKYDSTVRGLVDGTRKDLAAGGKDVNTLIRELQEKANQTLANMD
jgi:multiple sugar transport system substrate-binding protein